MDQMGEVIARELRGYVRWALTLFAFILLLLAACVGVPLGILLVKFFEWPVWLNALPGLGFALFVAGFGLWASMAKGRRPFLRGSKKAGAGA